MREKYAERAVRIAMQAADTTCCGEAVGAPCGGAADTSCCGEAGDPICADRYAPEELASVGFAPTASLGCGNPTLLADLHAGETVLDLGSGAGLDVLLSAKRVLPGGRAYGVDMTDEMLALARANQAKAGVANATFLKGTIEGVPLPDASVDVIISNCVINLAADKSAVLKEAFRLLRPGGRLAVSDMIALEELAPEAKRNLDLWAGCVAGTISREAYLAGLRSAGFGQVEIEVTREVTLEGVTGRIASASIRAVRPV